ncbi:MAG: hypothetical protein IJZ92_00110 [Bacteroidaceae bacterium]|nr:hypothetical protein [Bacteroidaceae bacterium]
MVEKIAMQVTKTVTEHMTKNAGRYAGALAKAAAAVGLSWVSYKLGDVKGHKRGKKEGVCEQAARDERKMKQMHQVHEQDRKRWKNEKKSYEELLDEAEQNL